MADVTKPGPERVTLTLEPGVTYQLHTARVAVGPGTHTTNPAYLTRETTQTGEDVVLEVRDRYNNAVPNSDTNQNLTVNVSTGRSQVADADGLKTVGQDGRVTFDVTVPSGAINFTLQNTSRSLSTANRSVNTSVTALGAADNGGNKNTNNQDGTIDGSESSCVTEVVNSGTNKGSEFISFDIKNSRDCGDSITIQKFGINYSGSKDNGPIMLVRDPSSDDLSKDNVVKITGGNAEGKYKPEDGIHQFDGGEIQSLDTGYTINQNTSATVGLFYLSNGDENNNQKKAIAFQEANGERVTTDRPDKPHIEVSLVFKDGSVADIYIDASNGFNS
ncbi:MAG: hypothetical protein A07HB70_01696 [uncultured archaeon A07HB70]|nr:MAG: hypothetical protein A07HB70_01696 [uncultured archaeon A07HB70]